MIEHSAQSSMVLLALSREFIICWSSFFHHINLSEKRRGLHEASLEEELQVFATVLPWESYTCNDDVMDIYIILLGVEENRPRLEIMAMYCWSNLHCKCTHTSFSGTKHRPILSFFCNMPIAKCSLVYCPIGGILQIFFRGFYMNQFNSRRSPR